MAVLTVMVHVEEIDPKTVEYCIKIPGLKVKRKLPGVGTAELKNNCSVPKHTFNKTFLEVVVVVKGEDGAEQGYKYSPSIVPREIIPEECKIKYKDGVIILVLAKQTTDTWHPAIEKGQF